MRSDARITACLVRAGPIRATRRGIEPQLMFMPSSTSGMRKCAALPQKRKSSETASATPPPMQWPSTAAMVTCSSCSHALHRRGPSRWLSRASPNGSLPRLPPSGSFRSKPAEKALAEPVRITTEVAKVVLEVARHVAQLAHRLAAERIDVVAAIETHDGDAALRPEPLLDFDELPLHVRRSFPVACHASASALQGRAAWLDCVSCRNRSSPSPSSTASMRCSPATPSPARRAPSSP